MSSQSFYKWANLIVFLLALLGLLLGIKVEGVLANSILKTMLWIIVGAWIGMTAYLGQKEITKDIERDRAQYEQWMWEARNKAQALEEEIARLKQQKP